MTLAQIMRLALCQLDEDPADIADYEERFRMYANDGYSILQREYLKPVDTITIALDEKGRAGIYGFGIVRIIEARDDDGRQAYFETSPDGLYIRTGMQGGKLRLICQIEYPPMENMSEEPNVPEHAHSALVDYVCFRYLSTGNLAKQSRAQAYRDSFYTGARRLRSAGRGSVTRMKNLYEASDIRNRW